MTATREDRLYGHSHAGIPNPPSNGVATPSAACEGHVRTSFAPHFDALIREHGLSNLKMAAMTGYDQSLFHRLRAGTRRPSRDVVEAIADALDLSRIERERLRLSAGIWVHQVPDECLTMIVLAMVEGETT